jgi:preprotein translocase subunit Sec61beta
VGEKKRTTETRRLSQQAFRSQGTVRFYDEEENPRIGSLVE